MFKKTALVAGIGLAFTVSAQADYRWEVGAGYGYGEIDADVRNNSVVGNRGTDIDEDIWSLYGTWYFENVDTSKGPLREAAFLDRASSVSLYFSDGQVDLNSIDRSLSDKDAQRYGISSRYVAEGPGWKLSGWLVDLGYERFESDVDIDIYSAGIGYYIASNTTLVLDYAKNNLNRGPDSDAWNLNLDTFIPLASGGLKLNAGGGKIVINNASDVESWNVGGTWYFNNNFGFGAGYQKTEQNSYEVDSWSVHADWFVTESFALNLSYLQSDFDDISLSSAAGGGKIELERDVIALEAAFRF